TDDERNDESNKEVQGTNTKEEKMVEEATHEEDEANELYRDVNVNLEGRDTVMSDAPLPNVQATQETKDNHVILTALINSEGQQQSSSNRLKTLENNFSEFKQTNQFAEAVSPIPCIFDAYLANKMNDATKTTVQLQSDRLRDEAQAKNEDFLNKLDYNIKKIIKEQVKEQVKAQTSLAIAANLSELELKKILIEKMDSNKLINRCKDDEDKDDAEKIESNNRKDDEDKDEETSAGSNWGQLMGPTLNTTTKEQTNEETSQHPDWFQKPAKLPTPNHDWNKSLPSVHGPVQPWLSNLAREEGPRKSFDELMDTPLYFLAFMMNCLKIDTLKPELLVGLTLELMKGTCKSLVELEYLFEEVYKATTEQLDWHNPEGLQYSHDLRKPLPLIPNSHGRQVIPLDHFINNDLACLSGGVSSRTYATSFTKTKAIDYGHIKWIEDLVPNTIWSEVPVNYDKHALWGISHWGRQTLTKLNVEYRLIFGVSLRMFTRSIVIQRRVEDLQLGVKSYQKKLNITQPDMYRSDLKCRDAYSAYSNLRGFIYQNKDKKNKLMCIDELYKFSDSTLDDV
ncbi:hypothetical protein Tco_0729318, partial [Tanacetum coccineum]